MALFDENVFNQLTSAGVYRMFARPTLDVLRRRHRTGDVEEDVTPGFMPGLSEYLRGPAGAGQDLSGNFLRGGDLYQETTDPKQFQYTRVLAPGVRQLGLDVRGAQTELLGQQEGLIKSILSSHATRGLEGSPAAAGAYSLGLGVFQEQAAAALAPLLETRQRAGEALRAGENALRAMSERHAELRRMRDARSKYSLQTAPGVGSVFYPARPKPGSLAALRAAPQQTRTLKVQPPRM